MESIGLSIAAVFLLLLANAFFVAAEFALVKAKNSRLVTQADTGHGAAKLTVIIQNKLESYLAACQLGITMASLGLGWIGEPAVAAFLEPVLAAWGFAEQTIHQIAFVVGFLVFSSLHIVLGEQVPKSFAIRKPEPVSILSAYPLQAFYLLAYPLTWMLDWASRGILSLFGVPEGTHAEILTMDELKGALDTSEAYGEIATDRAAMLRNLIELDQRPIGWVMIPRQRVTVLSAVDHPERIFRTIRDSGHSRFPLVGGESGEDLLGIVLARDLHRAMLDGERSPWTNISTYCREPLVIPERQTVSRAFETLRTQREHLAVVADEYGQMVGIVSLEDLLEEVVGEILDETDVIGDEYLLRSIGDGRWIIDGSMPLADVQREVGLELEFNIDANTLSGVIMERLGRIPSVGDSVQEGAYRLTVDRVKGRLATRVRAERIGEPNTDS